MPRRRSAAALGATAGMADVAASFAVIQHLRKETLEQMLTGGSEPASVTTESIQL
jgi:hypothetical protein